MDHNIFFANEEEERVYKQAKLDSFNNSGFSVIYRKYLIGGLFHTTTLKGFKGILESGCIKPNIEDFPITFPQTKNSFGYKNGYICLFDFSSSNESVIIHHRWKFDSFFCKGGEIKIILEINKECLEDEIIPNDANPPLGTPGHRYYIPIYEVWYPGNIPTIAIPRIIVAFFRNGDLFFESFSSLDYAYERLVEIDKELGS